MTSGVLQHLPFGEGSTKPVTTVEKAAVSDRSKSTSHGDVIVVLISREVFVYNVVALFFDDQTAIRSVNILQRFHVQLPAALKGSKS